MEIFNVSIPELMLIAGLALVVFGPERLPEVGRFVGKQVAKLLAWQQNSPEIQMLNEVRSEFETEIASLRDELLRTRKQLDVSKDITAIKEELKPMLDLRGTVNGAAAKAVAEAEPTIAPPRPAPAAETVAADSGAVADGGGMPADAAETAADAAPAQPLTPTPARQTVPAGGRPNKIAATEPTSLLGGPPAAAQDTPPPNTGDADLARRLQQIAADLAALTAELQARGQLGPDWQPPSQTGTSTPEQETVAS